MDVNITFNVNDFLQSNTVTELEAVLTVLKKHAKIAPQPVYYGSTMGAPAVSGLPPKQKKGPLVATRVAPQGLNKVELKSWNKAFDLRAKRAADARKAEKKKGHEARLAKTATAAANRKEARAEAEEAKKGGHVGSLRSLERKFKETEATIVSTLESTVDRITGAVHITSGMHLKEALRLVRSRIDSPRFFRTPKRAWLNRVKEDTVFETAANRPDWTSIYASTQREEVMTVLNCLVTEVNETNSAVSRLLRERPDASYANPNPGKGKGGPRARRPDQREAETNRVLMEQPSAVDAWRMVGNTL
jgi:hypothetical protein